MRRIIKFVIILIIILAVIASVPILFLFVWPTISPILVSEYLSNQPTVNVIGTIQHWRPVDGPSYSIIPDEDMDVDMTGRGIYLYGGNMNPTLNNTKVMVSGTLVENYREITKIRGFGHGGDPYTAVIFVDDVKIITKYDQDRENEFFQDVTEICEERYLEYGYDTVEDCVYYRIPHTEIRK